MPKPKGWTEAELKHRDKIERALRLKGYNVGQSFAIATSLVEKGKKKEGA